MSSQTVSTLVSPRYVIFTSHDLCPERVFGLNRKGRVRQGAGQGQKTVQEVGWVGTCDCQGGRYIALQDNNEYRHSHIFCLPSFASSLKEPYKTRSCRRLPEILFTSQYTTYLVGSSWPSSSSGTTLTAEVLFRVGERNVSLRGSHGTRTPPPYSRKTYLRQWTPLVPDKGRMKAFETLRLQPQTNAARANIRMTAS